MANNTAAADLCKGCVCASCALSEKQGNVYGCKLKRCKACGDKKGYFKLSYCPVSQPIQESGEVVRL